ncbi:MAG: TlpA family protein disulfide reductase [Deltaproteobacteria bacterium]|nr:TlpA family protein disulfide reductase [Deltaproteobacteria bacterium]
MKRAPPQSSNVPSCSVAYLEAQRRPFVERRAFLRDAFWSSGMVLTGGALGFSNAALAKKRAPLPAFSLPLLSGETFSSDAVHGKVLVISFWATWCAPCLQELPHLDRLLTTYKKWGAVGIAISTDAPETSATVASVVKRKGLRLPVAHDADGNVTARLNPQGSNPYTVFVDKKGRVALRHEGYSPGDEKNHEKILRILLQEPG